MFNNVIILQAAAPAAGGQGYSFLIMMVLVFVVMYFFMIRPQTKRQKELRKFQSELKKGDKIVTTGGIYGKVWEVRDQYLIIEIDENVKIRCDKSAILRDPSDLQQSSK
ncbi:MAG TPA: preprotein translocase subunit YajC [Williamwhitmania sp.]|nr:preprotein translocase subunit YajC [Williamwhitmania sp.]